MHICKFNENKDKNLDVKYHLITIYVNNLGDSSESFK